MPRAIEIAKQISSDLSADHTELLHDNNLFSIFGSVYSLPEETFKTKNIIVCFIAYAYSPDSLWLDLKKDRFDNKKDILSNLGAEVNAKIFKEVLNSSNENVGISVFNFLEDLKDWRWRHVFDLLDYASRVLAIARRKTDDERTWEEVDKNQQKHTLTEEIDVEKILKSEKEKGALMDLAEEKRRKADKFIDEIRKDFVATDHATQQDFGFMMSETAKKKDILSWSEFIKERNERKKVAV